VTGGARVLLVAAFVMAGFGTLTGQTDQRAAPDSSVEVLPVQGGIHVIAGAGGNVVVQTGEQGVLLVDTGAPQRSDAILRAIRGLSSAPIRYVINTSADADHVAGNEPFSRAGANEAANVPGNFGFHIDQAPIIATEAVYRRMSAPGAGEAPHPFAAWPTSAFFSQKKTMWFDGGIEILAQPAAHTDGDLIVWFRQADVVATGDVFVTDGYPVIDRARGGSIQGLIDAANHIIDITIPRFNQQGGTVVVPGHGRLCNEADVVEYRDMITIVRDRVRAMAGKGMTLEQVLAARPTLDYDGVYGATSGPWTTRMFVEAVYQGVRR
jgi:cyclase